MKPRNVVLIALLVVTAALLAAKYYKPMHMHPVNQQLASEIRQLQAGDLLVDSSGEICAVIRQVGHDRIDVRDVRDKRFEMDISSLAMSQAPLRLFRQDSAGYQNCAASYIKKERCQSN